jgi:DNA repair protein SbcC/Rad50
MIQSLDLNLFQSHKKTHLDFKPGVNTIIGTSDQGKSSIIRSIKWVVENRPSGESFRSTFASGETTVAIHLEDGTVVIRGRNNTLNYYQQDDLKYMAFGQDVPELIKTKLNMDILNFQFQLDPPFLLSESPGNVAKYLNEIVNLESIDIATKKANASLKTIDTKIDGLADRLSTIEQDIATYPDFTKLDQDIHTLQQDTELIGTNTYTISILFSILGSIQFTNQQLAKCVVPTIDLDNLTTLLKNYTTTIITLTHLTTLQTNLSHATASKDTIIIPPINLHNLQQQLTDYRKLSSKIRTMITLTNNIVDIGGNLKSLDEEISKWETTFVQKFPTLCPLCLQPPPSQLKKGLSGVDGVVRKGKMVKNG